MLGDREKCIAAQMDVRWIVLFYLHTFIGPLPVNFLDDDDDDDNNNNHNNNNNKKTGIPLQTVEAKPSHSDHLEMYRLRRRSTRTK